MKYLKRRIPLGFKALIIAALLIGVGFVLSSDSAEAANLGQGKVVNVTPVNTECISGPTGNGVQSWDVQQGGTYEVTIAGVTDAGNGGTDPTIPVLVKNSSSGNVCLTGFQQATGVYTFTITMPAEACNTFPITYGSCDADAALFARRNDGGNFQSHLRAATFDGTCTKTGNDTDCGGNVNPKGSVQACKFYDFNANGALDPGEQGLDGWPMTIDPLDGATPNVATQLTAAGGCAIWTTLDPVFNPYSVTEGTPNEPNWFHSTAVSLPVNVVANTEQTVNFGNYCKVPSGGLTLGFWSNKNGQALINAGDLLALRNLNLRNGDGSNFDPTTNAQVRTFLLGANATNMANMLSAQLTAMTLNIRHGFVDPNAFDLCSNKTVGQLVADANTALGANGLTFSGSPDRAAQEAMKNCIDALNNGGPVVPTTPCSRTFP